MSREQISALVDGELGDAHVNLALAVLREPEEQITWDLYHQIGDVLRTDEMAFSLSDGFAEKMRARLEAEPAIVAPQLNGAAVEQIMVAGVANGFSAGSRARRHLIRRFVMPGAAVAAAVVAVVLVAAPQQSALVASGTAGGAGSAGGAGMTPGSVATVAVSNPVSSAGPVQISSLAQQGEVARDPRIDEYLMAHQRFSPSMYSSAQYARSAGFAIDSDK